MKPFINSLSLILTTQPPTEPGYYWWTNRGEHTPCVLRVTECHDGSLYACNEEYNFIIRSGGESDSLWVRIPNPWLDGEQIKPDSF